MSGETLPLSQHELIGAMECAEIAGRVRELSAHWRCRSTGGFYSLGAASYMDAAKDFALYQAAAQSTNKILLEHFGGLYNRVVEFLRELLDEEVCSIWIGRCRDFTCSCCVVRIAARTIRRGERISTCSGGSPIRALTLGMLSFTLTVATPTGGAGLAVWPLRWDELNRDAHSPVLEQPPQAAPYALGRLVLHDGLMLHAIGAAGIARATGHRIILQGHGIKWGGRWWLYW